MPMFYIGSSKVTKIINGYHGSVSSKMYKFIWKNELKTSPNLFKTKIISTHKTRQEAYVCEERLQRKLNVVSSDLYLNMTIANGNFDSTSIEIRKLISESKLGKKFPNISKAKKGVPRSTIASNEHKEFMKSWDKNPFKACNGGSEISRNQNYKMLSEGSHPSQVKMECPHCKRTIKGLGNIKRYHFDKCKSKL
jgi:hypothetical protein